jgi:hypothetical protein
MTRCRGDDGWPSAASRAETRPSRRGQSRCCSGETTPTTS